MQTWRMSLTNCDAQNAIFDCFTQDTQRDVVSVLNYSVLENVNLVNSVKFSRTEYVMFRSEI